MKKYLWLLSAAVVISSLRVNITALHWHLISMVLFQHFKPAGISYFSYIYIFTCDKAPVKYMKAWILINP